MITVTVEGRRATASNLVSLPTGNVQSIKLQVQIANDDSLWQNALIVAVFAAKTPKGSWIVRPGVVDELQQTIIPGDVLSVADAEVFLGIRGTYADNREVTTNMVCLGKACFGAGGEIVDTQISDVELTDATSFLSQIASYVQSLTSGGSISGEPVEPFANADILRNFSGDNDSVSYNGNVLATQTYLETAIDAALDELEQTENVDTSDTLVPLSLGTTYAELIVRPDFQDVPVYIIGSNPVVCRLESDTIIDGFAQSEIRLMYLEDYQTGMPLPVLAVTSGGQYCVYFPDTFHDLGETLLPGWYDVNNDPLSEPPTFTDMTFDSLIIGNGTPITDLTDLSGEALSALETLSRMVNVSVEAMGGLGIVPDGVQRLNNAPVSGRRYAAVTSRNMTFPLPAITWTGKEHDFWVDLDCMSSINLTFSDDVSYEDGGNVDTTRGKHRLHFYAPAGADMWTVAETESVAEITEDIVPEYAIPFRNCTADQLRAVLKYGYSNNDGAWCVRKNGIEIEFFNIGDMRSVTLTNGQEVTMRIIGIQHDDIPGGGKAALTCDFVELIDVDAYVVNQNYIYDAWITRNVAKSVANLLPVWLYDLTVCAKKPCCQVKNSDSSYITHAEITTDKTWLLSLSEVALAPSELEHDGDPYAVFTDNTSRMRYSNGNRDRWLLRTGRSDSRENLTVSSTGEISSTSYNVNLTTVAVGFCLNA